MYLPLAWKRSRVLLSVPAGAAGSGSYIGPSVDDRAPDRLGLVPVLPDDRPERLVEVLAPPQEAAAQHGFFHGADLGQRPIPTAVRDGCPRFEAVHADGVECKVHGAPRCVDEDSRSPE